jgi:hypothetical protein
MNPIMNPIRQSEDKILEHFKIFIGMHGLSGVEIGQQRLCRSIDLFIRELKNNYVALASQYDDDCIYAGCLIFGLLETKPIILLETKQPPRNSNPIYKVINEEFALYSALMILKIKQSYITDKSVLPNFINSLCSHDDLCVKLLIEDLERLLRSVPSYLKQKG